VSETVIKRAKKIFGRLRMPGDKSISHRAALLSLLCRDPIRAENFTDGIDCQRSLDAVQSLGGLIETDGATIQITPPMNGMVSPDRFIDCGNSGTTMRLLAGLLAGSNMSAELTGDESLKRRPMKRIIDPLKQMKASIESTEDGTAPLKINPATLIPIDFIMPVASAQVKSALLLAGLASECPVTIREKSYTRNHTERMIKHLGGDIRIEDVRTKIVADPNDPRKKKKCLETEAYKRTITLSPNSLLSGGTIEIPGDISTAAYFIAAALLVRGSHLIIQDVGVNPTRTAFITMLKQMGAEIEMKNRREISGEPTADIEVTYSRLKPHKISGDIIPNLIDEIPILAVLASQAKGTTIIRNAEELRYKESDRIKAVVKNLTAMGVKVGEFPDGFAVGGGAELNGAEIDSFGDHRIAMAFAVAGLAAHGRTVIADSETVEVSCPQFFIMLEGVRL
jgi:3-phosphoshikimate 1-carboxyvinyltransferase